MVECRAADAWGKSESGQGTEKKLCGHAVGNIRVGDEWTEGLPPGLPDALMGNLGFGCTMYGAGLDSRSRTAVSYLH